MKIFTSLSVSLFLGLVSLGCSGDVPMTKWGKPSLQGNWDFRTVTPFQRPAPFSEKEFLTPEEVEEFEAAVIAGRQARASADFDGEYDQQDLDVGYNQFYLDQGTRMTTTMRTSQLIYPNNGRMPGMTARGRETAAYFRVLQSRSPEGPEDRNLAVSDPADGYRNIYSL